MGQHDHGALARLEDLQSNLLQLLDRVDCEKVALLEEKMAMQNRLEAGLELCLKSAQTPMMVQRLGCDVTDMGI